MAVYAIGDIQGCHENLLQLLERIRYSQEEDTLWFCGDLVNRGPDSLATLRFVKRLGHRAICVLGNHDLHLVAAARDRTKLRKSDTLDSILDADDAEELIDWLRRRPLMHHDHELGYTLVHAGLPPQWDFDTAKRSAREVESVLASDEHGELLDHMYGDQPDLWDDTLSGLARWRYAINCFTRLRFVTMDGRVSLKDKGGPGTQGDGLVPWFEHPQRKHADLHIIFGHWSTLNRQPGEGIYPLDTGCVWGGRLTALQLDQDGGWFSVGC